MNHVSLMPAFRELSSELYFKLSPKKKKQDPRHEKDPK